MNPFNARQNSLHGGVLVFCLHQKKQPTRLAETNLHFSRQKCALLNQAYAATKEPSAFIPQMCTNLPLDSSPTCKARALVRILKCAMLCVQMRAVYEKCKNNIDAKDDHSVPTNPVYVEHECRGGPNHFFLSPLHITCYGHCDKAIVVHKKKKNLYNVQDYEACYMQHNINNQCFEHSGSMGKNTWTPGDLSIARSTGIKYRSVCSLMQGLHCQSAVRDFNARSYLSTCLFI